MEETLDQDVNAQIDPQQGQEVDPAIIQRALAILQRGQQGGAQQNPQDFARSVLAQRAPQPVPQADTTLSPQERNQIITNLGLRLAGSRGDNRGVIGTLADAGIASVNDVQGIKANKSAQFAAAQKQQQEENKAVLNYLGKLKQEKRLIVPEGAAVDDGKGGYSIPAPRVAKKEDRKIVPGADGHSYYVDTGERVLKNVEKPLSPEQNQQNEDIVASQRFLEEIGVFDKKTGTINQKSLYVAPYELGPDGNPSLDEFGQPVKNKNPLYELVKKKISIALTPRLNQQGKTKSDERLLPKNDVKPNATGQDILADDATGKFIVYNDGKPVKQYASAQEARAAVAEMQKKVPQQGALAGISANETAPKAKEPVEPPKVVTQADRSNRRAQQSDPAAAAKKWLAEDAERKKSTQSFRDKRAARELAEKTQKDAEEEAARMERKKRNEASAKAAEYVNRLARQ